MVSNISERMEASQGWVSGRHARRLMVPKTCVWFGVGGCNPPPQKLLRREQGSAVNELGPLGLGSGTRSLFPPPFVRSFAQRWPAQR